MDSHDLTEAQARALFEKLQPMLGYLNKLDRRMEQQGFPHDDKLLLLVREARDAMHKLNVAVHYAGCRGQTGG